MAKQLTFTDQEKNAIDKFFTWLLDHIDDTTEINISKYWEGDFWVYVVSIERDGWEHPFEYETRIPAAAGWFLLDTEHLDKLK